MTRFRIVVVGLAVMAFLPASRAGGSDDSDLARGIRPILAKCVECHAGEAPAGGLDLTTRDDALSGGDSGAALLEGNPNGSTIYRQVAARKMPPKAPLNDDAIGLVRDWIAAGAPWDGPIAPERRRVFRPVERPPVPATAANLSQARSPIDAFIEAKLAEAGIAPGPPADPRTLIRRVTFDLTGLPPTPEEVEAFVRDPSDEAYGRLVDRLLASPHYGERWGRHWLDVVRFGESDGFEHDKLRDHAWRYRDYVIQSFNEDKPYDRFVREQVAGDLLEPATAEGIAATGFLVCGPWDEVGNLVTKSEVMKARVREDELEEIVAVVGQTFLGLTVNCARCHDHKFDPIPQSDYYRLRSSLSGVKHGNRPMMPAAEVKALDDRRAALRARIDEATRAIEAIEAEGRREALAFRTPILGDRPLAAWSFERDAHDDAGTLTGELEGTARVSGGRLILDGRGSLATGPLPEGLSSLTLEAWVWLANLDQRGGGLLTIEALDGSTFDAITFGEREPRKWLAGSENFRRSKDLDAPAEDAKPGTLVHVAVTRDAAGRVAVYRDGQPYGQPYQVGADPPAPAYNRGQSRIRIGLRHTGAANGRLSGEVEEARVYARALSAEEIAASRRTGFTRLTAAEVAAALAPSRRAELEALRASLQADREALAAVPTPPQVFAAVPASPPPPVTHRLERGDVEKPAEVVAPGALSALAPLPADFGLPPDAPEGKRRRALADWLASPENPLTPRVLVNRLWHYHFGTGLVASPSDFGANGEQPTHPDLLDWLATELLDQDWRIKPLQRRIVTSDAYKRSPAFDPSAAAIDVESRLLWRFPPRRLEAEAIRDAMLTAAGSLNREVGGPSFRPFSFRVFNSNLYTMTDPPGPDFARRSVYRMHVHGARPPLMDALDCPDPSHKAPKRAVTTTPLQALALMNDSFVQRQARALAERAAREADDPAGCIDRMYRLTLGRGPTQSEARRAAEVAEGHGLEQVAWALFNSSEFITLR